MVDPRHLFLLLNQEKVNPVLNLAGLIVNKRASARNKDLGALPHIEAALRLHEATAERDAMDMLTPHAADEAQGFNNESN